jgi:2,5-dioxopentanoate dehydrogenase
MGPGPAVSMHAVRRGSICAPIDPPTPMPLQPILIAGSWRPARATGSFRAVSPVDGKTLADEFPISDWPDCDEALDAAAAATAQLADTPREQIAQFLTRFAERIESAAAELVEAAHGETALDKLPRLAEVELPRTVNQLRQAAAATLDGSWAVPTIDSKLNLRSCLGAIGPVVVIGPNNFPYAYSGPAGGDFAAAIAAGNPVIAKGHPLHPRTDRLLAREAFGAVTDAGLPPATVQLIYHVEPQSGLRLVSDPRTGATAFTGSRSGGLKLKAAADAAGKPIYLELSSINPVVLLPGALAERGPAIAEEFADSCLLGGGQFCTNPGFVVVFGSAAAEEFIRAAKSRFEAATPPPLLSSGVARSLAENVAALRAAGAQLVTGGSPVPPPGFRYANTLLRVTGKDFLGEAANLQTEVFGSAALLVIAKDATEGVGVIETLQGNLTGSIYSDSHGSDDALYGQLAPRLRARVGRLLNDKMPTGVAVSPAMNHGGPYPATGHPGFTAVGMPASLRRFALLQCFDNVRAQRLPEALRDKNPNGRMWRLVDGELTQGDVGK